MRKSQLVSFDRPPSVRILVLEFRTQEQRTTVVGERVVQTAELNF